GTYSPDRMMGINGIQERADGSFLVTGFNLGQQVDDGIRTMVISPTGTASGATDHDSIYAATYAANTSDGGFAILGSTVGTGTDWVGHSLLRVDGNGQKQWIRQIDTLGL